MEWIQRNRKAAAALAALVVLSGLVLVWVLTSGSGSPSAEPTLAVPTTSPSRAPLTILPTPSASATPTAIPKSLEGAGIPGYTSLTGLKGHSLSASYPRHHLVLSLTSSKKLPFLIYNVPTSRDNRGGTLTDLGRTWSVSTTVYGKPDYAQLFTRADWYGTPITCTITVDGRVTARLTTSGPYGKVFCQG
jgi:hypothetical protein